MVGSLCLRGPPVRRSSSSRSAVECQKISALQHIDEEGARAMDLLKRLGTARGIVAAFLLGALVSGYVLATATVQAAPARRYVIAESALHFIVGGDPSEGGGAQCPTGYLLTGGGVTTENDFLRVIVSGPVVNTANVADTWVAAMANTSATLTGSFRIYAICLRP